MVLNSKIKKKIQKKKHVKILFSTVLFIVLPQRTKSSNLFTSLIMRMLFNFTGGVRGKIWGWVTIGGKLKAHSRICAQE